MRLEVADDGWVTMMCQSLRERTDELRPGEARKNAWRLAKRLQQAMKTPNCDVVDLGCIGIPGVVVTLAQGMRLADNLWSCGTQQLRADIKFLESISSKQEVTVQ